MKIINSSLHHINHRDQQVVAKDVNDAGTTLNDYVNRLIAEISDSTNERSYRFRRESTEVRADFAKATGASPK